MYTSPSPLPRRDPLRLPFSVHIRKLFFLFLSLFSGAPRRTHPVGAGVCPSVCPAVAPFSHPVGAGVLDGPFSVLRLRAAPASCMYASGGHISFNSERNMEKNAAKNQRFLDFPFPIATAVQKGSARNRLHFFSRCRSHVPQDSAASYCRGTMLRPLLYTAMYHDLKFSAAQRAAHTLAAGGGKCAI